MGRTSAGEQAKQIASESSSVQRAGCHRLRVRRRLHLASVAGTVGLIPVAAQARCPDVLPSGITCAQSNDGDVIFRGTGTLDVSAVSATRFIIVDGNIVLTGSGEVRDEVRLARAATIDPASSLLFRRLTIERDTVFDAANARAFFLFNTGTVSSDIDFSDVVSARINNQGQIAGDVVFGTGSDIFSQTFDGISAVSGTIDGGANTIPGQGFAGDFFIADTRVATSLTAAKVRNFEGLIKVGNAALNIDTLAGYREVDAREGRLTVASATPIVLDNLFVTGAGNDPAAGPVFSAPAPVNAVTVTLNGTIDVPDLLIERTLRGGSLVGQGTITGNVTMDGQLDVGLVSTRIGGGGPIGTLAVGGNLVVRSAGMLGLGLGNNGTSDLVSVGGAVTLDGRLLIALADDAAIENITGTYRIAAAGSAIVGSLLADPDAFLNDRIESQVGPVRLAVVDTPTGQALNLIIDRPNFSQCTPAIGNSAGTAISCSGFDPDGAGSAAQTRSFRSATANVCS